MIKNSAERAKLSIMWFYRIIPCPYGEVQIFDWGNATAKAYVYTPSG